MSRDNKPTAADIAAKLGPQGGGPAASDAPETDGDGNATGGDGKGEPEPQRLSVREQVEADAHAAIARALAAEKYPAFNTHSMNLSRQFEAMGETLLAQATDVRRKIRELEAEYTDLMLAFSMLTKGEQARQ